jgi:hypothetical protein
MGAINFICRVSFRKAAFEGEGRSEGGTEFFFSSLSTILINKFAQKCLKI